MSVDIHTLVGAYALDAVSDIERKAFDRHLAECPSCALELAELRATVTRLNDLNIATPPPRLKQAVLAGAARTRQVPPGRAAERPRQRSWRTWAAGVAAAAAVAVAGGAIGYAISDQNTRAERAVVASQASMAAQVANIMSAPDASVHVETVPGGGKISVVVSPTLDSGVAVVTGMPAVSTKQSYQLWLIHGTDMVSAGVMTGGQTSGTLILHGVKGAAALGVTLERAGGASVPTLPPVTSFAI